MIRLIIPLLLIIAFHSNAQPVVIDGYINNANGSPVSLSIDRNYSGIHPKVYTAKTHEGNFSFVLHEQKEFFSTLIYSSDSCSIFLVPGDTLHIAFTADLMNITLQMTGNAAGENIFLKSFSKKFNFNDGVRSGADELSDSLLKDKILNTGVDAFEIDLFNERKKQMDFFKADSSYSAFSPAFKSYFTNLINYRYWNLLLAYPVVRANASKSISRVDELPTALLDGIEKVKVSNSDALICSSYRSFLKYYVTYFTSKQNGFNKFNDFNLSIERKNAFAQTVLSGIPYQYWLSGLLLEGYDKAQPSVVKRLYTALLQSDKTSAYASFVNEKCGAYMEKKDEVKKSVNPVSPSSGGSSPDVAYRIVNEKGKPVKFSDFKGKVVYVDFWASWCGPCRQEMPHSKELHKKFTIKQLKNLVFLYISIDKDEAAWRKAVNAIGMEGYQGWSSADWRDGAGNFFYINSIPRYMLIDKSGKIVDDNAKRPSDPEVVDDILKLLQ